MITFGGPTFQAPKGMSCVNVCYALWEAAPRDGETRQSHSIGTAANVADLFRDTTYFDCVAGKGMGVDFSLFPIVHCGWWSQYLSLSAGQNAVVEYNKIPSSKRFDSGDTYQFTRLTTSPIPAIVRAYEEAVNGF